jgi:hypothetical protein
MRLTSEQRVSTQCAIVCFVRKISSDKTFIRYLIKKDYIPYDAS